MCFLRSIAPCGRSFFFPSFLPSFSPFLRSFFLFKWKQLNKACGVVRIRGWAYLMLILSVPSVLAFLRCNRTCSPSKQEDERWPVQFFGEIKRSHSSFFPNVSCSPLSVLSFFIEHYLLPSPTSPAPPPSLTGDGILDVTNRSLD